LAEAESKEKIENVRQLMESSGRRREVSEENKAA
jgi:hypothetical protein